LAAHCVVGWTNLASRMAIVSPNDLRALLGDTNAIVTMRGTLIETPHWRITERDGQQTERSVAQVQVTACAAMQTGDRLPVQLS